jgi:hypothetical protein
MKLSMMGQENDDLFNTGDCLREPRGDHRFDIPVTSS